ncbi:Ig-like domain-containing protein [Carboxylicivirga linearis]|uniref:Ig-like domain-containing protein n=1 Tax=Carboxylicivirga linearis TaxID=1628157 RepID=A0ABS5JVN7_9BACT|nr:Ig-like domain-containing protein [Carboxylicivirga linearis]MBS2098969.1 Ig-like domain-containing protein [Carboxylicivirga linearis]
MKNIYAFLIASAFLLVSNLGFGQAYTSGYPNITNIEATQITFNTNITNTGGNTYYTKILIKSRDAGAAVGEVNALASYTITVNSADQEFSIDITGLSSETDYTAYCVSYFYNPLTYSNEYLEGALSNPATAVDFTTSATPPPSYADSYPNASEIQETQITFNTNLTNTEGNTYYTKILVKSRDAGATIGEVNALATNTITVNNSDEVYSTIISGLTSGTEYTAYCVSYFYNPTTYDNEYIESGAPSGPATAVDFTTAIPFAISSYLPIQNATSVPVDQNPQLTFNQDIQWADISLTYYIRIYDQSTGNPVQNFIIEPGNIDPLLDITNNKLSISLRQNLDINTQYYITIPNGVIETTYGSVFTGINNSESNNWRFTTVGVPIWADGYPFTENLTLANIDFVGQTDKDGTYNYIISASASMPTASQVKNGFDGDGSAALISNSGSPGTMTTDTNFGETLDISSLTAETTYYMYLVATSSAGSLDSEVIQIPFTTLERNPPVATFNPIDGANNVSILTNVVITFDEPVRMLDGTIIDNSNVASLITFLLNPANPVAFTATIDATKSIITISPDEPLNDNSGYDVTIVAVEDYYGNQQLSSSTASFSTDSYVTWNGGNSSDWTANQNWDGNFNEGASVHILSTATNMPVIDGATTIQNILIDAGASLSITTNGDLTVNGDLTLNSSNDELIGNASLINNGSISVDNSNVHIHQRISSSSNAYYISSPVSGVTMNDIGCDYGMSYYDNTLDSYAWMTGNDFLSTGTGYLLYSYSNLEFSGAINDANQYLIPLLRTANAGLGWNLVGNPYPASINWDLIDEALKVDIVDAIWIYLNDQGLYGTYSPIAGGINLNNGEIPSNHSFWLKVLEGNYTSGSITLPKTSLVSNSKTILKSTKSSSSVRIKLAGFNDSFKDETAIAFSDLCDNLQDKYDAEKKFSSNKNYFQIYTIEPFNSLAINSKAALTTEDISIHIGFRAPKTGSFSIKAVELSNIPTNKKVLLEDTYNETIINLSEQDSYSFSVNKSGNNNDRFIIHIENELSTSIDSNEQENIRIYGNNDQIIVEGNTIAGKKYEITTLDGRTIKNGIIQEESKSLIQISYKGIVIVRIFDNQSSFAQKVLLK